LTDTLNADCDKRVLADRLTEDARRILPGLQFCGSADRQLSLVSDCLIEYVRSLLSGTPVEEPDVSIAEWRKLLACLSPHWVLPLLYYMIGSIADEYSPPGEIVDRMRMEFLRSRVRAEHMNEQLARIVEAFNMEGVRILVLKGPAMAHGVYPDTAARPFSDLDLLVLPGTVAEARRILTSLEYDLIGNQFEITRPWYHHENYSPPENSPSYRSLELHWDLTKIHWKGWEGRIEGLFDRAVSVSTDRMTFDTISPVDSLNYRALGNTWVHYREMRLIWIYDFVLLARQLRSSDDWSALRERCREWQSGLAVESSFRLARDWAGLRKPEGYDDTGGFEPSPDERKMWDTVTTRHSSMAPYFGMLLRNSDMKSLTRAGWSLLFPKPSLMRSNYPPADGWRLPAAYIRRWWRWATRGFR
jgi:hypothetical protein